MSRIVILGAGESGTGAAVLAKTKGHDVFVSDMSEIKEQYKRLLNQYDITWEEKKHSEEKILNADEIIKSPGIPDKAPIIQEAKKAHIHIISEIEFAGRYTTAKMICITGSNGKTTTTSLIYHLLSEAKMNVGLAGNIGKSLALQIATDPHDIYVIELSSFQLDNMYDFKADIAVLMNITPDHLDRYDFDMQKYTDAKMRITQNQNSDDAFVYWADDERIKNEIHKHGSEYKATKYPFTENTVLPGKMTKEQLSLKGKHNLYNSLAAGITAEIAGVPLDVIQKGLSAFPGVEHRLERAGVINGVEFINDSKATNVDACWYALESMTKPTVLILGGIDKGNDYSQIYSLVKDKCVGLVFMGTDNQKLHDNFDSFNLPIKDASSMEECLNKCWEMAQPGQCVLLSPCCASFDLFKNMEDRGEQFKYGISKLGNKYGK